MAQATAPAHSERGASSAKRWMTCHGSVRLCRSVPKPATSKYAALGSLAHLFAEFCLRPLVDSRIRLTDPVAELRPRFLASNPGVDPDEVDEDMVAAVQQYVDFVREQFEDGIVSGRYVARLEVRLSLESLSEHTQGMFGTADLVVYDPVLRWVWVLDYKHGQGIAVEAIDNEQTQYYGLAAVLAYGDSMVEKLTCVIVQPRAIHSDGPIRQSTTDVVDLVEFTMRLLEAAEATEKPDAKLVSGEHCRFCPASALCPRLAEDALLQARLEFSQSTTGFAIEPPQSAELLTASQLVSILDARKLIEGWLNEVEAFAHAQLESGNDVTGGAYKLVPKRAVRKWAGDESLVADALCEVLGLGDEDMFKRSLRSPADIEKKIPKDKRGLIEPFVSRESSGTTLAPASDPRPAVSPANAAQEFGKLPD